MCLSKLFVKNKATIINSVTFRLNHRIMLLRIELCKRYLAQWLVRSPCIQEVLGSNPIRYSIFFWTESYQKTLKVGSYCFPTECTALKGWSNETWGHIWIKLMQLTWTHGPRPGLFPAAWVEPWASCFRPSFPSVMITIAITWAGHRGLTTCVQTTWIWVWVCKYDVTLSLSNEANDVILSKRK